MGMVRGVWAAAVIACTLGGAARAEENASEAVTAAPTLPSPASSSPAPADPPKVAPEDEFPGTTRSDRGEAEAAVATEPTVQLSARVLARGTADERNGFERELGIAQARLTVKASFGFADAVIEGDLARNNPLRDAYLRLRATEHLRFYGGQFKAPFMQRVLESSWDLPRIGRGLVEEFVVDDHQLGGRRLGVMAEGRFKKLAGLRISGGLFQGATDLEGNRAGEDASARVSFRPWKPLTLASSAYLAELAEGVRRFATGGDATLKLGGLTVTAEALFGRLAVGRFTSQNALVTYDVPVGALWVLQPTLGVEGLQLRGEQAGVAWGGVAGLNAVWNERVRVQLQGQRMQRPGDQGPGNDLGVQVGAKF